MTKEEFRQALKRHRISIDEFATMIGRDVSTVYDFGVRYPVPRYVRKFLALLDILDDQRVIRYLITGSPEAITGSPEK